MNKNRLFRTIVTLLLLAGCSQAWRGGPGSPKSGEAAGLLPRIAGAEWRLVRLVVDGKDLALAPEGIPTLAVDDTGKVQGLATLNRYFARAEFGEDGRLRWDGPFGATRMAGPEALMNQEQAFLGTLERTRRAVLHEGRLLFQDTEARTLLEFGR